MTRQCRAPPPPKPDGRRAPEALSIRRLPQRPSAEASRGFTPPKHSRPLPSKAHRAQILAAGRKNKGRRAKKGWAALLLRW
jgi:hypothetical protein